MGQEKSDAASLPKFDDERDTVVLRAQEAEIKWSIETRFEVATLSLELPNGRNKTRRVWVDQESARRFLDVQFEDIVVLGPYDAITNKATGVIEAQIEARGPAGSLMALSRIREARITRPNQEVLALFEFEEDDEIVVDGTPISPTGPREWAIRLETSDADVAVEISRPSPEIGTLDLRMLKREAYRPWPPTLKILGLTPRRHDEALSTLEDAAAAFFFELDLKRNIAMKLSRARVLTRSVRALSFHGAQAAPLSVPRRKYSNEAVSLYTYGRSATDMPLLQFLAFYQCIEYYFPQYWNAELIARMRRALNDPRFNPDEDPHVGRLLQIAGSRGRTGASEREQLRTTVDACVDPDEIAEFIGENEAALTELTMRSGGLTGVAAIKVNDKNDKLTNQVANRIYDLRNRVVHAKEDGGPAVGVEVLLPFSAESERLTADVALIRFIAQKVIIADRRGPLW